MKFYTEEVLDAIIGDNVMLFQKEFRDLEQRGEELGLWDGRDLFLYTVDTYLQLQRILVKALTDRAVNDSMMRLVEGASDPDQYMLWELL